MNFFEVLGIVPPKLALDSADLEKRFYQLSREWHPDRHGGAIEAVAKSAEINGAYRILRDPWKRAGYVLELYQMKLDSKVPPGLAPLYFELQEIEDVSNLESLRAQLEAEASKRAELLRETFQKFDQRGIRNFDVSTGELLSDLLSQLRNLLSEHKYSNSILRDLTLKMETR